MIKRNIILESVNNSNVYVYYDEPTRRICGIVNRLFLDNPSVEHIISYAKLKKNAADSNSRPCYGAWEIVHAAADRGTGIDLFFEFMSMSDVEYIMCDRIDLSPDAEIAWKNIVDLMGTGSTVKLDNFRKPRTPEIIDDCMTWEEKYGLDNPYDQVIKVPDDMTGSHQHINLDQLLDRSKLFDADLAFRIKWSGGYNEMMVRRDYEPGS